MTREQILRWENAPFHSARSGMFADYKGVRFYVRRRALNARDFKLAINGNYTRNTYSTLEKAKEHAEQLAGELP